MLFRKLVLSIACLVLVLALSVTVVSAERFCVGDCRPATEFIEFQSIDLAVTPPAPLTVKGKLKLPVRFVFNNMACEAGTNLSAVVIVHGSAGIDFRGDFYARALNAVGIATLEIDMWEARAIESAEDRPPLPLFNYPDAFGALRYLSEHANIDPDQIGILGFSWGGVVTMASATELYASQFGGELRFAAHVAHYPVCFAYNSPIPGTEFTELTGAPLLIQIGEEDDYDEGVGPCMTLKESLPPEFQPMVEVASYEGAFHAWDRLEVPITVNDPFSHLGAGGEVAMTPFPEKAYKSRRKAVMFFLKNL